MTYQTCCRLASVAVAETDQELNDPVNDMDWQDWTGGVSLLQALGNSNKTNDSQNADISTNVLHLGVQLGVQRGRSEIVCDPLTISLPHRLLHVTI